MCMPTVNGGGGGGGGGDKRYCLNKKAKVSHAGRDDTSLDILSDSTYRYNILFAHAMVFTYN